MAQQKINSNQISPKIQSGWGYLVGAGLANAYVTVTFPQAFSSAPDVIISPVGYKSGSNPTDKNDIAAGAGWPMNANNITTTQFTANYSQASGTLANTVRIVFQWIAVGV